MGATTVVCFTEKMGVSLQPLKVKKKTNKKNQQTPTPQKAEIKPELPPALLAYQDSQARRPGSRSAHDRGQWILPGNGKEGSGMAWMPGRRRLLHPILFLLRPPAPFPENQ